MEVGDIANGRTRPAYEGIECWVALNAEQVDAMLADGAEPDVYSKRFGLRQTPEEALGRAAEFMAGVPVARVRSRTRRALSSAVSSYQLRAI